jgi:hypothetical protein
LINLNKQDGEEKNKEKLKKVRKIRNKLWLWKMLNKLQ